MPGGLLGFSIHYDVKRGRKVSYSREDPSMYSYVFRGYSLPWHRGRQLTPFAGHSRVEVYRLYGRQQDPDWPALEEKRHRRHLPGDPAVFRGVEHDGDPAQVWRRGAGANPRAGATRRDRPAHPRFLSHAGQRKVLGFRWTY